MIFMKLVLPELEIAGTAVTVVRAVEEEVLQVILVILVILACQVTLVIQETAVIADIQAYQDIVAIQALQALAVLQLLRLLSLLRQPKFTHIVVSDNKGKQTWQQIQVQYSVLHQKQMLLLQLALAVRLLQPQANSRRSIRQAQTAEFLLEQMQSHRNHNRRNGSFLAYSIGWYSSFDG
jgi:signal transduction histidine kinase